MVAGDVVFYVAIPAGVTVAAVAATIRILIRRRRRRR